MSLFSRLIHPRRVESSEFSSADLVDAFIDSRTLEYAARLEDAFVQRALNLGVEGGMILDVGTRVGLIALKILWQNDNFYAIGMDRSSAMVERARETAVAWGLGERGFFQVGDVRRMRFKSAYFDLMISDATLHCFDDPLSVLSEVRRVLKPTGALLIRDVARPKRFDMSKRIKEDSSHYGSRMRQHVETSLRSAYTRREIERMVRISGLERANVIAFDSNHIAIERRGETDPNSWIKAREQYL
jgi:ubiquinone/menaquinone biosynthesis C-methylase UbiE